MLLTCHECKTINKLPAQKLNLGPKCGSCSTPLLSYPIDLNIENFKEALANCRLFPNYGGSYNHPQSTLTRTL